MPEMVSVDEKNGIIQITSTGTVSLEELSLTLDAVLQIIDSQGMRKIIIDTTGTNKLPFIFHLHVFAREILSRDRETRHSILVAEQTSDDMLQIEHALAHSEDNIKLFTSREKALSWLIE